MRMLLSLWITVTFCVLNVNSFNIDLVSRIVHKDVSGSWFGYAVDIYSHNGQNWAIIGAPKAQTQQPNVRRGGGVFRCSTDSSRCSAIYFDLKGHDRRLNGSQLVQIDSKSDQWFGATVVASKDSDAVLACAPRYTYFYSRFDKMEPVGTCYLATNFFRDFEEFSPCRRERMWGYHRFGYCLAGFSAAISQGSDKLFIGAPGAWYSQGSLVVQNAHAQTDNVYTREGPKYDDDTYMAYATVAGDFNGDGVDDAAVGTPRGNNLTGMVTLMDDDLRWFRNMTGEQQGSYFGSAISLADVDGDGETDLIIGAPLFSAHSEEKGAVKMSYEVGKVYVYFQGRNHRFRRSASVQGKTMWGRFGHSVAGAGDLNGDGYEDFLVGAPYDGPQARGAVYVFNGMDGGMREKSSQVIFAEDVDIGITSFGWSLAAGKDVDENEYPDTLVGAYASSRAVLFKTRPVISVTGTMKINPDTINLEPSGAQKMCRMPNGEEEPCAQATLCLQYTGKGASDSLRLQLKITLDAKKRDLSSRAKFLATGDMHQLTITPALRKDRQWCQNYEFSVSPNVRDKLTPIIVEVNYTIFDNDPLSTDVRPALDALVPESIVGKAHIAKFCGSDNVCVPDLQLEASLDKEKFVVGADDRLKLDVTVENGGEDAYEAQFFLFVPAGLEYVDYQRITGSGSRSSMPVTCAAPVDFETRDRSEDYIFTCDIGNPLKRGRKARFQFEFSTQNVDVTKSSLEIRMLVNSTNNETDDTMIDNEKVIDIPLEIEAKIVISGLSIPESVSFEDSEKVTSTMMWDSDIGPLVTHLYEVRNIGTSDLKQAAIDIYWPSFTQEGHSLLYLITDPLTEGDVVCKIVGQDNINPMNLRIFTSLNDLTNDEYSMRRLRRQADKDMQIESPAMFDTQNANRQFQRLVKRIKELGQDVSRSTKLNSLRANCSEMQCTQMRCETGPMRSQDRVIIRVVSRLFLNSLIEHNFYDAAISSVAIAKVTELPYKLPYNEQLPIKTAIVSTLVNPRDPTIVRRGIPWWLILIAILAGLTLLILLILLLWKCGFFKRNRPPRGQALLEKPPESEYYGYSGYSSAYAPASQYSESQHGRRL